MVWLVNHFAHDAHRTKSEQDRQRQWFIKARHDQKQRDIKADKEEGLVDLAAEVVSVTELQLAEFRLKLERYETATVNTLMLNQKQLDEVNAQIELLLEQAYVLPDGRRVFKTEDGTQVFDEFGQEVSADEVDFDDIGPNHPSWEHFQTKVELKSELQTEQAQILAYQQKLDDAHERADEGDLTQDELDELEADLESMMPDAVREQIPDLQPQSQTPSLTESFKAPAMSSAIIQKVPESTPALTQ